MTTIELNIKAKPTKPIVDGPISSVKEFWEWRYHGYGIYQRCVELWTPLSPREPISTNQLIDKIDNHLLKVRKNIRVFVCMPSSTKWNNDQKNWRIKTFACIEKANKWLKLSENRQLDFHTAYTFYVKTDENDIHSF